MVNMPKEHTYFVSAEYYGEENQSARTSGTMVLDAGSDACAMRGDDGLCAMCYAEFREQTVNMVSHGVTADGQGIPDLGIAASLCDELQDFQLSWRQRVERRLSQASR